MILLASEVMDLSAASLNDADKTVYKYNIQIPYLKMALQELQEIFELNSLPITQQTSAEIRLTAGDTSIQFNVTNSPRLPDNLIEPQRLWEQNRNTDSWIPMTRKEYMPHGITSATNQQIYWVWQGNKIILLPSNQHNDIKIDYLGSLFPKYVNEFTIIGCQNGQGFLSYRTAALIKELIERDLQGAGSLNGFASLALDRIQGISIKGKQSIMARRRPFRAGYKSSRMG